MEYSFCGLDADQERREIIFLAERMHVSTASWLKSFELSDWRLMRPSKRQRQGRNNTILLEKNCMASPIRVRIFGSLQSGGDQVSSKVMSKSGASLSRQANNRRSMR